VWQKTPAQHFDFCAARAATSGLRKSRILKRELVVLLDLGLNLRWEHLFG
jgi:hypothetical protein